MTLGNQAFTEEGGNEPSTELLWHVPDYSQLQTGQTVGADSSQVFDLPDGHLSAAEPLSGTIFATGEASSLSEGTQWPSLPSIGHPALDETPGLAIPLQGLLDTTSPLADSAPSYDFLHNHPTGLMGSAQGFPQIGFLPPDTTQSHGIAFSNGVVGHPESQFSDCIQASEDLDWSALAMPANDSFTTSPLAMDGLYHQAFAP